MSSGQAYFEELMNVAADPAWRKSINDRSTEGDIPDAGYHLDPSIYVACFSTPAGRAVLADMYNRYVNVSRFVPEQGPEAGYYREGMAQVVFEIVAMIEATLQEDELPDGT